MRGFSSNLLVLVAATALSACGKTSTEWAPPNDVRDGALPDAAGGAIVGPWRSGTRLRARVKDGGDGARLFVGWWDQKLGLSCSFRMATDDKLRCLPDIESGPTYRADDCSMPSYVMTDPSML